MSNPPSPDYTADPAQSAYEVIDQAIKKISWSAFEDLVMHLMCEGGFVDVQRLSRGSQQGKDVIGLWPSRFRLGLTVRFRFQAKHKEKGALLSKADVGDSITDFLSQTADKVLLIVTNAKLSNDLIDQVDRLLLSDKAVQAISAEKLFRLVAAYPSVAIRDLGLTAVDCENVRHQLEFQQWIDNLASFVESKRTKFSFYRFWTEPYKWFFYKDNQGKITRVWTTVGGDFRFNCFNSTDEIQNVGRIMLNVLSREDLPRQAVINCTPKGGHDIRRIKIPLSKALGSFQLNDRQTMILAPNSTFSCLVAFEDAEPGIYRFQVRSEGLGGPEVIRDSPVYTIVALPPQEGRQPRPNCVEVLGAWPLSLPIIHHLLGLPVEEFANVRLRPSIWARALGIREGQLLLRFGASPEQPEMVVNSEFNGLFERAKWVPLDEVRHLGGDLIQEYVKQNHCEQWLEEYLDPSEPRCVCDRANDIEQQSGAKSDILGAIEKAYERGPQFAKLSASYACHCLELGYLGHAKFYMDCAYSAAPENPAIAGLAFALRQKLDEVTPKRSNYEAALATEAAIRAFELVCNYIEKSKKFPCSYWEAACEPFSEKPELGDDRIFQRW